MKDCCGTVSIQCDFLNSKPDFEIFFKCMKNMQTNVFGVFLSNDSIAAFQTVRQTIFDGARAYL